jgi:hypothetical protein
MSNNLHWGLVVSTGTLSPPFHGTFKIFDSILALRIKNLQRCQAMNSMATILYCGLQRNRNEWTFCKCHTEAHPKTGESILGPSRFNSWFHCHVVLDQFVHKGTDLHIKSIQRLLSFTEMTKIENNTKIIRGKTHSWQDDTNTDKVS